MYRFLHSDSKIFGLIVFPLATNSLIFSSVFKPYASIALNSSCFLRLSFFQVLFFSTFKLEWCCSTIFPSFPYLHKPGELLLVLQYPIQVASLLEAFLYLPSLLISSASLLFLCVKYHYK